MARNIGGFGMLAAPKDGRDFAYSFPRAMAAVNEVAKPKARTRPYNEGPQLDQGMKPHCVAFSGLGFMGAAPLMRTENYETTTIYGECQRNDEWPGENYDGTSVRALMKVMSARGYISSYVWGQTTDEMIEWLVGGYGTIIVGTNWYESMDEVPADGVMRLPGTMATPIGGHAYRVRWFDKKEKLFWIPNSWGYRWGIPKRGGYAGWAKMRVDDMARLIREYGEVASATQIKLARAA